MDKSKQDLCIVAVASKEGSETRGSVIGTGTGGRAMSSGCELDIRDDSD